MRISPTLAVKVLSKAQGCARSSNPDDCWIWLGAVSTRGYPVVCKQQSGDRLIYEITTGEELTSKQVIHHKCENTRCLNPKHLVKYESNGLHISHGHLGTPVLGDQWIRVRPGRNIWKKRY
jgi:hypothetical protein